MRSDDLRQVEPFRDLDNPKIGEFFFGFSINTLFGVNHMIPIR